MTQAAQLSVPPGAKIIDGRRHARHLREALRVKATHLLAKFGAPPKLTVVLRKSYGGAYITMNSRDLGADLVLAWPDAELGIMSARAAVSITARRELRAADDPEAARDHQVPGA